MTGKIFYLALITALSGFLFGFDTAVISGAEQTIQNQWGLSDFSHGFWIMSSALIGTVFGALFGYIPMDKYGRKNTLIYIGVLYLVSAIGCGFAWDHYSFGIFRFLGGIGVGVSSVAAPTYLAEISPAHLRGRLGTFYQFQIVLGIFISFFSNYFINQQITDPQEAWRWMLGIAAIPALIYLIFIIGVPESPRWLAVVKNKKEEALKILNNLNPNEDNNLLLQEAMTTTSSTGESIFTSKYAKPLTLAFLVSFFNQASGINFIIYYAPRIFESTGLDKSNSLMATMGIGLVNLIMTMAGVFLIDRLGRRVLMIIGSLGYIISLALVAMAFFKQEFVGVDWFIFLFIAAHAIGQGAVIWVYISEVFPNKVRAQGQSFGTSVHWVGAALITLIMPAILKKFDGTDSGYIFTFFCILMVVQLIWALFFMYETKGRSLESLEKDLIK